MPDVDQGCVTHHHACPCRERLMERVRVAAKRLMDEVVPTMNIVDDTYCIPVPRPLLVALLAALALPEGEG